ncbi:hypothetical protein LUZ60_013947 [Juncus effusus]|nr:hypothetical protein LUZ60_013947 [Juncus effusus]
MDAAALAGPLTGTMWATKSSIFVSKKLAVPQNSSNPSRIVINRKESFLPRIKSSDSYSVLTSEDMTPESIFPAGLEPMLRDICDETSVAEVKLKIGNFEMYLKRETEPAYSPSIPPHSPVSATSASASAPAQQPAYETRHEREMEASISFPTGDRNPFGNPSDADVKLAFINQGSGSATYEVVTAPMVGIFLRSRVAKGVKRPPVCKKGTIVKEGCLIGFIKQFSTDHPVRSTVAGEVVRFMYKDGEPVGFGDPLVAVLPSFHGNEIGL